MPDWLAVTLAVASPVLSVLATLATVMWTASRRFAVLEERQSQHSDALRALPDVLKGFVTADTGKGLQAQLERLERFHAEQDGRATAIRTEVSDRVERLSTRVAAHEQASNSAMTTLANAIARLETTMGAMKESVDRLTAAEQTRPATQPLNLVALLSLAAEVAPMVRQLMVQSR